MTKLMGKTAIWAISCFYSFSPLDNVEKQWAKFVSSYVMGSQHLLGEEEGFLTTLSKVPTIFCQWLQITWSLRRWKWFLSSMLRLYCCWAPTMHCIYFQYLLMVKSQLYWKHPYWYVASNFFTLFSFIWTMAQISSISASLLCSPISSSLLLFFLLLLSYNIYNSLFLPFICLMLSKLLLSFIFYFSL